MNKHVETPYHTPVLVQEIRELMNFQADKLYLDCTIGTGGLAYYILLDSSPTGKLIGLDCDGEAIAISRQRLEEFGDRLTLIQTNFRNLKKVLEDYKIMQFDGVVFDLGISSLQLGSPQRGFSFQNDGPLDMRMTEKLPETASDLVNGLSGRQLKEIFQKFGGEKRAQKIAKAIVKVRQKESILTTGQLVKIILDTVPVSYGRHQIHPATRAFQALRIAVNDELESLKKGLEAALAVTKPGGRMAVISFHSLEDRIVKDYYRKLEKGCICPPDFPKCCCNRKSEVKILTKKPITPGLVEIKENPKCRSAKLRVVEKSSLT